MMNEDQEVAEILAGLLNATENAAVESGSLAITDAMDYRANDDGDGLITIVDMDNKFQGVISVRDDAPADEAVGSPVMRYCVDHQGSIIEMDIREIDPNTV